MEFDLKAGPQGHFYFPKKLRKMLGDKITVLPNETAAAIYSEDADPEAVILSLQLIVEHLKLKKKARKGGSG